MFGNETIFEGINRIAPGQTLTIKDGQITSSITNSLSEKENNFKRVSLNELINESVNSHLEATFLIAYFFRWYRFDAFIISHGFT